MSYTNPNGQPQGYAYHFTNKIREALISELVAINGYQEHIANSNMQEVNEIWNHIIKDEKEHYGNFLTLLRKYDPAQYHAYSQHINTNINKEPLQTYTPDFDKQLILNNIREDIKGEFEAVVLYEQIAFEMPYQDIKDTFHHIINVEKEHAEHLTKLLVVLDDEKYDGLS